MASYIQCMSLLFNAVHRMSGLLLFHYNYMYMYMYMWCWWFEIEYGATMHQFYESDDNACTGNYNCIIILNSISLFLYSITCNDSVNTCDSDAT